MPNKLIKIEPKYRYFLSEWKYDNEEIIDLLYQITFMCDEIRRSSIGKFEFKDFIFSGSETNPVWCKHYNTEWVVGRIVRNGRIVGTSGYKKVPCTAMGSYNAYIKKDDITYYFHCLLPHDLGEHSHIIDNEAFLSLLQELLPYKKSLVLPEDDDIYRIRRSIF